MATTRLTDRQVQLNELLDQAMAARIRNDAETAIAISTKVLSMLEPSDHRPYWIAHSELGAVYLVMVKDYAKAEHHYGCAVAVRPESEWMSVGLFNALVRQGFWIAGLREVLRFVTLRDSKEYRELLTDEFVRELGTVSDVAPDVLQHLAREAKRILAQRN